jgi:phasin family protein
MMALKEKVGEVQAANAPVAALTDETTTTVSKGVEQTVATFKDSVSAAQAGFESTQTKMKQQMEKAMKTAEELVSFGQGNLEAVMKSSQIWTAGVQDISKQVAASAQASFDESLSTFKALTSVRSLKDALDLQTNYARSSLEKAVTETGRITDASLKLAEQAWAPITARVTLAVEKFAKTA